MSRHLLLTAWAFAPARTSGVYRAIGLANAFSDAGWRVTVLTAPEKVFSDEGAVDTSLNATVADGIVVRRVPFLSSVYSTDISTWTRGQARQPELWAWWHGRRFPEHGFGDWRRALSRAAFDVHRHTPVDLTLGTAGPSVDFIPGWELKRRTGVPSIMDYRDAWTFDTFTGLPNPRASRRAERWEPRLMASSDQIWFVNDPIREWHARKYPQYASRMRTVANGFDETGDVSLGVPFVDRDESGLTFGYIGTINTGRFPAEPLLSGWIRAREQSPLLRRSRVVLRGHLGRTGVASEELAAFLRRAAREDMVFEGPVARADVSSVYRDFDALVLALPSGPGITSGKVFEYAATGLPIVSIHDPSSAVAPFMAESPAWVPTASLSPEDVAAAFIETARLTGRQTAASRDEAIRWGAQWERGRQLSAGVRGATELLEGRS
ncbi:glycosyl transferase [Microbacterium sp.]|uniref:glycosyl transferase n=1 Tax=Microbacterium sp. TaxID=51671 RepID=UPI002CACA6A1|nr:glycosyl transferase [Microbacterium sp.]HWK77240.1 glycosyl transferase [Microbacterium sp.]